MSYATCHPKVKHHAKGLCRKCYNDHASVILSDEQKKAKSLNSNNWNKANKLKSKSLSYQRKYGLTLEQVEAKIREQESRCAICKVFTEKLHVDHHHDSKTVRGMLCGTCNRAIGGLRECPDIILSALKYLFYWAARYGKNSNV